MIITDVVVTHLREVPFPQPLYPTWRFGGAWTGVSPILVRIHTDAGITGIGATQTTPSRQACDALIGQDPFATEQHIQILRHTSRNGNSWVLDLALWDLIGKACGQPLYKLWGGYTDRVLAYASLAEMGTPQERAEMALRLLGEGYKAIKLRLRADTVAGDVAQVAAVRAAVGDQMEIMVDANQSGAYLYPRGAEVWTYERALRTAQELEQLGVVWLEEPLPRYDYEHLVKLCDAVSILIAGGESQRGLHEFRDLIERNVYDVIQPEGLNSEGISQLRKIAALAELHYKPFVPHNGLSGVGLAAHLHLCASLPNAPYVEYIYDPPGCTPDSWQVLLSEPLRVDSEGYLRAPEGPGLGIELDEDLIAAYAID
jgi:L-alanine-DL-glutamate epimerase-like enolase superfamily enzyme